MKQATKETKNAKERLILEEEQERLTQELAHLRESMLEEVDIEPDEGDPAFFEREKSAALIIVLERRLQDIAHALHAMEAGSYGICDRCNKPIEPGRLEVKPDATLCLNCQKEVEAANRRNRPRAASRW